MDNKKITIYDNGHIEKECITSSRFFEVLESNDARKVEDWLNKNGNIKPYCPIRLINKES